jgi:hypothetical protein
VKKVNEYFESPAFCSRQGAAQLHSLSYESEYVTCLRRIFGRQAQYWIKRWLQNV